MSRLDELKKKNGGAATESRLEQLKKRSSGSASSTNRIDIDKSNHDYENSSSSSANAGWQKYLKDEEARRNEALHGKEDEKWWEKIGRWLGGGTPDTSLSLGTTSQVVSDLREDDSYKKPTDEWKEAQKIEFGNLYLSDPDKAFKYAEETNNSINKAKEEAKIKEIQDSATDNIWSGAGNTAGAIASASLGLVDFLQDLAYANAGREIAPDGEISPFEYSQAVTSGVGTHLNESYGTLDESIPIIGGKGLGDLYGLGTSIAQSAVSGLTLGGAGTLISYFGQGAASGVDDALSRGATEGQAVLYGTALGVFEGLAEKIGIDNLFKLGASTTVKETIKNILKQAGSEGLEEGLTSILGNIADNVIMQDQSNFNAMVKAYMEQGMTEEEAKKKAWMDSVEGIAFDTLGGFVSGGVHAGAHTGVQSAVSNYNASKLYGDKSQMLIDEALAVQNNSDLQSLAEEYKSRVDAGKNLKGSQINRLIDATDAAKLKNSTLQRLGELGETSDVTAVAKVLNKYAMGEELTSKDWSVLNDSKAGHTVLAEMNKDNIKSGILGNKWAENISTRRINPETYNKALYDLAKAQAGVREAEEKASVANTIAESETATGTKFEASDSGKTTYTDAKGNTRDATVKGIVSTKGGLKVELEGGITVNATDLSFGSKEEALMYEMVARMDVTPETANEIISTFKPTTTKQAAMYFSSIPLAYKYGTINYEAGLKNIHLSEKEKRVAFNRGKMDAIGKAKSTTKTANPKIKKTAPTKKNGIIFEDGVHYDESTANELQKASMIGIETIAQMSSLEVHVFESVVEDGERVFYLNGESQPAPNGYFKEGNKIYIDLNAGSGGEGAMLYTMSHEVTHYIRQWNAKGFRELGDFLLEQYGKKGVPVNALIEKQKDKIKKRHEREKKALPSDAKLADMAYEELVADAMSDMFTDPKAYEKLAKLKQKNKTLWQKVGEAIKTVLDKLKTALGIYKTEQNKIAVAQETHEVRAFSADVYEKLQDLYIKAFVQADANYEASNDGKEVISEVDKHSERDEDIHYSFRDSENGMANDALSPYDEEFTRLIEQRGDYIVDSFDKLKHIVNLAFDNPSLKATAYFGIISAETLEKIKNSIPNLPKAMEGMLFKQGKDYSIATTFDSIRHLADDKNLSKEDVIDYLDRLADTVIEFDSVAFDFYIKGNNRTPGLLFKKAFPDGIIYNFDLVSNKKKSLSMHSLYLDSASYQKKKSAKTLPMQNAPGNTPKTQVSQTPVNSIPQNEKSVNSKFSDRDSLNSNQFKNIDNKNPTSDPDIRFSEREIAPITEADYKDLEKHFGTTGNFKVAGYLLTDGKLLDFSGKHWGDTTSRSRQVDHRDVQEVLGRGNNGINDMVDMIGNGNIRLMPETGGINLAVYPNEKQRRVLSTYINYMLATEGQVIIDYDSVGGDTVYSKIYEKGATSSRILSDIRNYFNGGRPSDLMSFHTMYSDRDTTSYAPTFYSHMGKVIDDIRLEKMGAGGVVSYLKGKGVKDEEIKWSGIESFLEGKKSVTKAELQEFVAGSQLQIVEQTSGTATFVDEDGNTYTASEFKKKAYAMAEEQGIDRDRVKFVLDPDDGSYVAYAGSRISGIILEAEADTSNGMLGRWSDYKLEGGSNYRELVFQMPNSWYSNSAMRAHWGDDAEGVLAHARIQDMTTADGKKMLFIEELQSDWHNEGLQSGYIDSQSEAEIDKLKAVADEKFFAVEDYSTEMTGLAGEWETIEKTEKGAKLLSEYREARDSLDQAMNKWVKKIPDAPFRNTYHEYVLKRLLRMAAEEGYDSIGWTPSGIQSDRWSDEFAEAYRIEYDQDMPKFLRKYGKKWGATVGKADIAKETVEGKERILKETELENVKRDIERAKQELARKYDSYEKAVIQRSIASMEKTVSTLEQELSDSVRVWSMDIPDSMTESVLYEGQVLYSDRDDFNQAKINLQKKYHIDTNDVLSLANRYLENYTGNSNKTNIRLQFLRVTESIAEIFATGNTDLLPEATKRAEALATDIEQARATGTDHDLVAIKNYLRKIRIKIPTFYKAEFDRFGGLGEFRKKHMGKFILSKDGIQVDSLYPELQELFGTVWFPDIDTVPDQLMRIAEVTDTAAENINESDYDIDAAIEYTREEIMGEISDLVMKSMDRQSNSHIDYRDPNAVSNRTLLANALESVAQNDIEKNKLTQYKKKIALIESEQKKLAEIRAEANTLRFTKGRTKEETKRMHDLDAEATQIANRISTWDKQLLNLESTTAIKNVLEREKAMLRKKLEQKGKQALKDQRQKDAATTRELLTRYQESRSKAIEGRHKTEIRHKIKNVVSDLNKLLLNPTKDQHVPIGLQLPVAEALDAINMDTMNAGERVAYYNDLIAKSSDPDEIEMLTKKRDFFEYRDANFKERITALKNAYAEFKESDDPLIRNAHNDAIEDLIKNTADAVGNKSLKDMSLAQLEAVHNMYKAILATVRNSNKMFKEGRQETVTENSEAVKTEVKEVGGHKDRVLKVTKSLKKFGWNMLKPITAMKVIGSKTFEKLFDNVRAAEDTWAVDVNEAKRFYEGASDKYGFKKWDFKKRYSFKDSAGTDFSLSLEQIMSLYAYSKREQADKHLEFGGFIFDDAIEVTEKGKLGIPLKYEVNDANPYRLRKEDLLAITDALTGEQKAFIDEMQTYLSEVMGEKGNEVSLAMYDIKLYNEKNYFPLKTSRYFREFDPEKSGTPKIKNSGFSKKTVPQAGNPIVLSNFMDVWASHVNDMSMYHAFVLPLEDFMRVYNYSSTAGGYDSVQQYIKNAYGSQANQYIEKLMDDLNGGARVDSSAGVINKGLSLFKKASVFASASVVVQQPSAIARAMAYINPKYFVTSTPSALNLKKHKSLWAEVKQYAPVAVIKEMGYFDTGVGRSTVEWLKGNKTIKDKMDDVLSKAPAIADELCWVHIWEAVKKETAAKHGFKVDSEDFLKESGRRFTEIITNTQVYDSVLSRSGMMRSKDTGMKMATAFMAEPTTTVNMMVDGIIQGKRGNKKFTAATVGAISASIILNSILVALVYAARDDDEDETYTEKYIGSVTSELLDGFNPLTYVPFVKDIWSIAQGYDVERSDMSVVSKLWESIEGLFNEDKSGLDKVLDAAGAVSSLFGIPLKNIIRDAKGMYNLTETVLSDTETTSGGIKDTIEDSFKSSIPLWDRLADTDSKSDNLYDAIMSGDSVYVERLKKTYKTEDAYETAVRKALREHDSRIHEAAQARYEGDISTYTRIAKAIIAEGNFLQDTVVGAINAEISAIKKGEATGEENTEANDEVTSIYSGSDINSAFDNGNDALALEIIDDLIETKVANGMEEKNAKSSVRSSMTSYWKPLYKQAYQSGDSTEMLRIRRILLSSGLYGTASDVVKTAKDWLKS